MGSKNRLREQYSSMERHLQSSRCICSFSSLLNLTFCAGMDIELVLHMESALRTGGDKSHTVAMASDGWLEVFFCSHAGTILPSFPGSHIIQLFVLQATKSWMRAWKRSSIVPFSGATVEPLLKDTLTPLY